MMLKNNENSNKNGIEMYKSMANALSDTMNVISFERNYIRKTLSGEMDYLMQLKDNDLAQREIKLFNEIISRMIKDDRKGDEIYNEQCVKQECREIDQTKGQENKNRG